ncbi:MAG: (2Fe-2S)-binding protein [Planctomycetaceae bacterium]
MRDQDHTAESHSGFNRRDFLKGSGAAVAATAIVSGEAEAQAKTKNVVPARAVDVQLKINGRNETLKLEPRTTLLDALRNWLNLTGCKEVCDTTNCGACTVQVDGKALYACSVLAIECEGKQIKTVESMRSGEQVDEVISGFVKHDAMQCGFCTPGFVVATRTVLDKNPQATREQLDASLGGNICRCGTYNGIADCALEIAKGGA